MSSNPEIFGSDPEPEGPAADAHRPAAEELPPVEPPSAGFIFQLFLVPALIVLAVVGVWALFGMLAAGKQDWHPLVADLSSSNEHQRWRAAHGLAQMLQSDRMNQTDGGKLASNPLLVEKLTTLFQDELARTSPTENELEFQVFLARTLGMLDSPDRVLPVLTEAMTAEHDREVRKSAIASIAVIAGRAQDRGEILNDAAVVNDLIEISHDPERLVRQLAAYALGLIPTEESQSRLRVMLDDIDMNTRLNAAVGLARSDSTAGLPVFEDVLEEAAKPFDPRSVKIPDELARNREIHDRQFQRDLRLKNTLDALEQLAENLTADQREQLITQLGGLSEKPHVRSEFRFRARAVRRTLQRVQ